MNTRDREKTQIVQQFLLTPSDATQWRSFLPARVSVFGSVEFAAISEKYFDFPSRLFVLRAQNSAAVQPFFLRPLHSLPFAKNLDRSLHDVGSPDYTGPMTFPHGDSEAPLDYTTSFDALLRQIGVVAKFSHLHPWNADQSLLDPRSVQFDREIVYVDLTLSEEQLWVKSLTSECRTSIRKSDKRGVRVFLARGAEDIREFHRVYISTMDRRNAQARYYHPLSLFLEFYESMQENAQFFLAEYNGRIVAAALMLHDDQNAYGYLGGSDFAFRDTNAWARIIYEQIRWSRKEGKKRLILGGGHTPGDGIFRFKSSFSPLRAAFRVYRQICMPKVYDDLCTMWAKYYGRSINSVDYFPAYREIPSLH